MSRTNQIELPKSHLSLSISVQGRWRAIYRDVLDRSSSPTKARKAADLACGIAAKKAADKIWSVVAEESQPKFAKLDASASGTRFKKYILPLGKLKHPLTGQVLDIDASFQDTAVESCNRFLKNGNQIAFPDGHSDSCLSNMGWWESFAVDHLGTERWVSGIVRVADADIAKKLDLGEIKYVSPRILGSWEDAKGETYENVFVHVCGTLRPVVPGQSGFERVELALGGSKRMFSVLDYGFVRDFQRGEKREKKVKNIAIALGLDDGADESKILEAIQGLQVKKPENGSFDAAAMQKLELSLEKMRAENEKLSKTVENLKKSQSEEFCAGLQAQAVSYGKPIEKAKLDRIQKYYDAGLVDDAKELGASYLEIAKLSGARPAGTVNLSHDQIGKPQKTETEKIAEENRALAALLRAEGRDVELSADGLKFVKNNPPAIFDPGETGGRV